MLSVVLYGRNDSHGYNLHKRGAISLNCISELLTDPDDEIIFVDYNSPDQLPTFPEAILDTLTDKTLAHLRIIRVREAWHRQFAGKTHLVALESQSRNIAIRRANPANSWVLSTNTDMIFVPRADGRSLSQSVDRLEDGFYHLPRFEIPENLWETLDRRDPAAAIERVRRWGTRFHLNEIVYGGYDNVYEAPGDFQLFTRADLERIGGFDESMIRGWHVDSNIARRMKLLRGEVRSALDEVFGYHCGHTRQATTLHRSGFVANSLDTYVRDVTDPVLHEQLRSWGAPGEAFEERRLTRGGLHALEVALETAIEQEGPETSEVAMNDASFDATGYEPSHVLPHAVNLLSELPPRQKILLIGDDARLFAETGVALDRIGLEPRLLWADGPVDAAFARAVTLEEGLAQADVILLQFPSHDHQRSEAWLTARWQAQRSLEAIIAAERTRAAGDRRLVLLVNAAHTPLQDTFIPAMTFTAIPYTARLRHGYVAAAPDRAGETRGARLYRYGDDDLAMIRAIAAQDDPPDGWQRLSLDLPAMIEQAGLDPAEAGVARLLEQAQAHVQRQVGRCAAPAHGGHGRDTTRPRLASATDWEDPSWLAVAERCFTEAVYAEGARSRWTWERASLVHALRDAVPTTGRPWVLVVTNGPDCLPTLVGHAGYRVAYTTFANLMTGQSETSGESWAEALRVWHMIGHGEIVPLGEAQRRGTKAFDAVLMAGCDISAAGPERLREVRRRLVPLARPDAFVAATAQVYIDNGSGGGLTHAEWCSATAGDGAMGLLGLTTAKTPDTAIPIDCAVRYAPEDDTRYVPGLSFGWGDAMVTLALLAGNFESTGGKIGSATSAQGKTSGSGSASTIAAPQPAPEPAPAADLAPVAASPAETAIAVDAAMPHSVAAAAATLAERRFGCRVLRDIDRDIGGFAHATTTPDGGHWRLVPIETTGLRAIVATCPGGRGAAVIEPSGNVIKGARGGDASWRLELSPDSDLVVLAVDSGAVEGQSLQVRGLDESR